MISAPNKQHAVIPAQAGIQNGLRLDPGFRRSDGLFRGIYD